MKIELLYFDGCPNHELLLPRLRDLLDHAGLDEEIHLRRVESLEAAGDAALRADPDDPDAWAAALVEAVERRDELVPRGLSHARQFTWAEVGELMLAAWEEAR